MIWRGILGNWAQPNRQHDMHELLLHVMPRLQLGEVQGTWQTGRLEETGTIVCNSADTALPITLDIPCVGRGLQQCASVALPAFIALHCFRTIPQLSAFISLGTGVLQGEAYAKTLSPCLTGWKPSDFQSSVSPTRYMCGGSRRRSAQWRFILVSGFKGDTIE